MSTIVIFGGTGYAGGNIAREAASRGHQVISYSRTAPAEQSEGVEYRTGSLTDDTVLAQAAADADDLGHLAPPLRARPAPAVAAGHLGGPVAHLLDRGAGLRRDRVGRGRQRVPEPHAQPRLLEGLAHRGDGEGLAGVELALGPRPVVVPGTVDEGDLKSPAPTSPRQGARGQDGGHRQRRALRRRLACIAMRAAWMSGSGDPSGPWCTRVQRPSPSRLQWA